MLLPAFVDLPWRLRVQKPPPQSVWKDGVVPAATSLYDTQREFLPFRHQQRKRKRIEGEK